MSLFLGVVVGETEKKNKRKRKKTKEKKENSRQKLTCVKTLKLSADKIF